MRRTKFCAGQVSLLADEEQTPNDTKTRPEDPYWFTRRLSWMLLGERHALQGGAYARAEVEAQLSKTLCYWCRFVGVDAPTPVPASVLADFEALFIKHFWIGLGKRPFVSAETEPDYLALTAVRELVAQNRLAG